MSYELIAILMFSTMMLMLFTGQRVFGAIGFVGVAAALLLWGDGGNSIGFAAAMKLMKWYPLLTLPMFIFMGYVLSESKIADDLYKMFHVWMGPIRGGLAVGTILLMVLISAMNGLSVAGMAIGATIALPELLKRNYDKLMVTGVIQAGSSLGILVPPSVVLVLYAMIARQPVGQLWLAGVFPGLLMAALFIGYIWLRCKITPSLGPVLSPEELDPDVKGDLRLIDCEDNDVAEVTISRPLLDRYKRTLAAFIDGARDFCNRRGMAYLMASTETPVEQLITNYLRQRGLVR